MYKRIQDGNRNPIETPKLLSEEEVADKKAKRKQIVTQWEDISFCGKKGDLAEGKNETSTKSYGEWNKGQKAYIPDDVMEEIETMNTEQDDTKERDTDASSNFQSGHFFENTGMVKEGNRYSVEEPGLLQVAKFDPQTFIAKRSYDPIRDDEISVKEGECLSLIEKRELSWKMKSQRNLSKVGYVPASMLRPIKLQDEQWYFGDMDLVRTYKLLLQKDVPEGTFLVRDSATCEGILALSVKVKTKDGKPDVLNYKMELLKSEMEDSMYCKMCSKLIKYSNSQELIIILSKNQPITSKGLVVPIRYGLVNQVKDDVVFSPLSGIKINPSKIKKIEKLGEGYQGVVYKATWTTTKGNVTVAVKESKIRDGEDGVLDVKREAETMCKLLHPNIVSLYGYYYDKSERSVMLVCEFVRKGDLRTFLEKYKKKGYTLNETETLYYALQVASGMKYLASQKIVHRDLAARNVLLGENQVVKIADFGHARFLSEDKKYAVQTDRKMPQKWTAPEALQNRTYTEKSDVWSYSIFLTELVTGGDEPYKDIGVGKIIQRVEQGYRMPQSELNCSEGIYTIMASCWQKDPSDRPNFETIFKKVQLLYNDNMEAHFSNYNLTH
ncbi:Tyrosine-protein kinase Src42A [Holothuria leucospilota]|uniref:Tyrosine-protein kinase n=1 Tax=Holothuria leucospilota TaxID=206669 RepID=A0A9Q1BWD5_HOLLE|nr:Tyrosine-protein kinase Src42A [Holothuria leucospilota]